MVEAHPSTVLALVYGVCQHCTEHEDGTSSAHRYFLISMERTCHLPVSEQNIHIEKSVSYRAFLFHNFLCGYVFISEWYFVETLL